MYYNVIYKNAAGQQEIETIEVKDYNEWNFALDILCIKKGITRKSIINITKN